MQPLYLQISSDVNDDCLAVELVEQQGMVVAEIRRYDRHKHLTINTHGNELDVSVMQKFVASAFVKLRNFDDGTPLLEAQSSQSLTS